MSADSVDVSTPVVVQRWRRYGHDRAYVKVGERDLGYRDLNTGELHCKQAGMEALVTRATDDLVERVAAARYEPKHAAASEHAEPSNVVAKPTEQARMEPDRDLALNMPGSAARLQAKDLRDAAPVRTIIARLVGAKTDERNWRIGADAEEEVARQLTRLGTGWHVLHAVPIGDRGSDIDHVVVGPAGVFTLNVKHHPQASVWVRGDTFKVNGYNEPYVRNSRFEAQRAAKLLTATAAFDVDVRSVIVVVGAHRGLTIKEQPRDGLVSVVGRKQVTKHLSSGATVLDTPSIERIYEVARHLSTWQPATVQPGALTQRT